MTDYVSTFTIANVRPQNSCCTGPLDSGDGGHAVVALGRGLTGL